MSFKKGCYGYMGSALNGLEQRVRRHLSTQKKLHWHVDYLLASCENHPGVRQRKHTEGGMRHLRTPSKKPFDACLGSDAATVTCQSHLFFGPAETMTQTATSLQMKPYPLGCKPLKSTAL